MLVSAENRSNFQLALLAALCTGCVLLLAWWQSTMVDAAPLRWLLATAAVAGWHLNYVWRRLGENRFSAESSPYPTLGLANSMSILRGILNAMLAGFIFAPLPNPLIWLPATLWTTSALLDIFDGVAARMTKRQSQLGASLDMEFDAAAILIICTYTVAHQLMPAWYLLLGLARYLFVAGLAWRTRRGLPVASLTDSAQRRVEAGLQMAFMTVVLWPIVGKPLTTVAAYSFGLPFAALFLRDWLVVSTALNPEKAAYLTVRRIARTLAYQALPLLGRGLLAYLLFSGLFGLDVSSPIGAITLIASGMLLLGVISRFGAIFLLIPLVFGPISLPWSAVLLVPISAIIKFGGGPFCLWLPEEALFTRRLG